METQQHSEIHTLICSLDNNHTSRRRSGNTGRKDNMIKLNKQVENLESVIEKIENKIETLEEKKQSIIDNADEHERDLTDAEYKRIEKIDEQIDELSEEADSIQNAIDYLSDYAD